MVKKKMDVKIGGCSKCLPDLGNLKGMDFSGAEKRMVRKSVKSNTDKPGTSKVESLF